MLKGSEIPHFHGHGQHLRHVHDALKVQPRISIISLTISIVTGRCRLGPQHEMGAHGLCGTLEVERVYKRVILVFGIVRLDVVQGQQPLYDGGNIVAAAIVVLLLRRRGIHAHKQGQDLSHFPVLMLMLLMQNTGRCGC